MGNASITNIVDPIWNLFEEFIPSEHIQEKAEKFLEILEDQDWDCQQDSDFVNKYFNYRVRGGYYFRKPRK